MKRILLVLSVAALMVAMVAATALPAFAKRNCTANEDFTVEVCRGGDSFSQPGGINSGPVGGSGGLNIQACDPDFEECVIEFRGGGGFHFR